MSHLHKLVNSGRGYHNKMFNGILEAISGKQYDSPSYEIIATHSSSTGEVSQTYMYDMALDCLSLSGTNIGAEGGGAERKDSF